MMGILIIGVFVPINELMTIPQYGYRIIELLTMARVSLSHMPAARRVFAALRKPISGSIVTQEKGSWKA